MAPVFLKNALFHVDARERRFPCLPNKELTCLIGFVHARSNKVHDWFRRDINQ